MGGQIKLSIRKLVEARDEACWHCAKTDGLQVHHRRGRGMGGVKGKAADAANSPQNLIRVCADYNYLMESNARVAARARGWGHKLSTWDDTSLPVFDCATFTWYVLTHEGEKVEVSFQDDAW